ncbi:MAG: DinB family protein [Candidatus Caldarchaeum sp.]
MDRKAFLELLLHQAYEGSPWHSLCGALDGIKPEIFQWRPESHYGFPWMDGSIRDILFHVIGDKMVQLDLAFGDGKLTWDEVIKRVPKSSLEEMMPYLHQAQSAVISTLRNCAESKLDEEMMMTDRTRLAIWRLFLMFAEHDVYHAGQIRYVRNLLERRG